VPKPSRRAGAGPQALEEDVGLVDEPEQHVAPALEVERE
jgi:hypothetical protein